MTERESIPDSADMQGALGRLERWIGVIIGPKHAREGVTLVMDVVSAVLHAVMNTAASMTIGPYLKVDARLADADARQTELKEGQYDIKRLLTRQGNALSELKLEQAALRTLAERTQATVERLLEHREES